MPIKYLKYLIVFCISLQGLSAFSQDILQGNLIQGEYNVGFKRIVVMDSMRSIKNDLIVSNRPVIINMWYPAQDSATKITYDRYLNFDSDILDNRLARNLNRYNQKMTKLYGFNKKTGILLPHEIVAFRKWKKSETLASENALPIQGRFPLIIYHQGLGASISDNQAFIEYLVSYGFVVCNAAYQANDTKWPEVNGDVDISIPDMNIIIETARNEQFVNRKIGLMGHSVGATLCMRYIVRGKYKVDAIALYDQGINYLESYSSERDESLNMILSEILGNVDRYVMPILYTSSEIKFLAIDSLVQSQRTYLEACQLAHEDFTSNGIIGRRLDKHKKKNKEHVNLIQENYELLSSYSRCFFQHNLSEDITKANSLSFITLPKNRFKQWERKIGENPTSGGSFKQDSAFLNTMVGTYTRQEGKAIVEITFCKKAGKLVRCSGEKRSYKKNGKLKKTEKHQLNDTLLFVSLVDYRTLNGRTWGEFIFDENENCIGFTSRDYTREGWFNIVRYERKYAKKNED